MRIDETQKATKPILEIGDLVYVTWDLREPFYGFIIDIDYEYGEHSYLAQPFQPLSNPLIEVWLFDKHMGAAWKKV